MPELVWHSADAPQIWRSWPPPPGGDDEWMWAARKGAVALIFLSLCWCTVRLLFASHRSFHGWPDGFHSRADAPAARARRDWQRGRASPPSPPPRWPGLGLAGMLRLRRSTLADGGRGLGVLRAAERKVLTEMGAGELLERHDEVVRARRQEGRGRGQTNGLCRDCISSTLGLLKKKFQTRGSMMGIQPRDGLDAMPRSP